LSAAPLLVAGDVGGTKTNLGLFRWHNAAVHQSADPAEAGRPHLVRGAQYASADYPGLAALLGEFLAQCVTDGEEQGVRAACFGVPGPVVHDVVRTPNLAWEIDCREVAAHTGIPAVRLVNDLVATAEGIPLLEPDHFAVLQEGDPSVGKSGHANRALIAAGTGLGMSLLPRTGDGWRPVASEGGHMDFAPRNDNEWSLRQFLSARLNGRVSVERVVSGPGLVNIYEHLRAAGGTPGAAQPPGFAEDPAQAISEAALAGSCSLCTEALRRFVSAYGAAAGNLALTGTATGGLYLGGGIAPKILPTLRDGTFLEAFRDKGRFRGYMEAVPVRVILDDRIAMFGAARLAAELAGGTSDEKSR
jgi:glucokinase